MAKCPVCDDEIENAVTVQVKDREVAVCCRECADKVQKEPEKHAGN